MSDELGRGSPGPESARPGIRSARNPLGPESFPGRPVRKAPERILGPADTRELPVEVHRGKKDK